MYPRNKNIIGSWGRLTTWPHEVIELSNHSFIHSILSTRGPGLAYGMGRSYGDVCLNPGGTLWKMRKLDRFISFDEKTGRLKCQSGVLLSEIQALSVPRGWILPVTPGTQFITVGGAIANDIHGKNQHTQGSFGHHVLSLKLMRTTGEVFEANVHSHRAWLHATIGGLGLTGIILEAELQLIRLKSEWLKVDIIPFCSLEEFFSLTDAWDQIDNYTASWIDCLAKNTRGIFMRAKPFLEGDSQPLNKKQKTWKIFFELPFSPLNQFSLHLFNSFYYYSKALFGSYSYVTHYTRFLYPLDAIKEWNRLYGPHGFYQYQALIPYNNRYDALKVMLETIAQTQQGSFLSVLKTFGPQKPAGLLSFPEHGVTLALDFPNKGEQTLKLFQKLDTIVHQAKGRLYLAKDARMPRAFFEESYPKFNAFLAFRDAGITSALAQRLMGV